MDKALSDTSCNVKFSFCFTSKCKAIWMENLVVNKTSLRTFFHAPLQLTCHFKVFNILSMTPQDTKISAVDYYNSRFNINVHVPVVSPCV